MQKRIFILIAAIAALGAASPSYAQTKKTTTTKKTGTPQKTTRTTTPAAPARTTKAPAPAPTRTNTPSATPSPQPVRNTGSAGRPAGYNAAGSGKVFEKGAGLLNVGVGLGAGYGGGLPIGLAFDYGVTDNISIGAQVDYLSWRYNYPGWGDFKYRFIPFGIRGAYHFDGVGDPSKVDLYLGVVLGYWFSSYSAPDGFSSSGWDNAYGAKFLYGAVAGGRYMFSPKAGAFAELGYSVSYGKVGLTVKL